MVMLAREGIAEILADLPREHADCQGAGTQVFVSAASTSPSLRMISSGAIA
jgi:hypothetical protein